MICVSSGIIVVRKINVIIKQIQIILIMLKVLLTSILPLQCVFVVRMRHGEGELLRSNCQISLVLAKTGQNAWRL